MRTDSAKDSEYVDQVSIEEINEVWADDEIESVLVHVRRDTSPHNIKKFRFTVRSGDIEHDRMDMTKGSAWTWSEQEILSLSTAYRIAKQTAQERVELSDVLK